MYNSMTSAMRAKDLLQKHGVSAKVIRTPANLRRRSCGYSLLVKKDFDNAVTLIKNANVKTVGVAAVDLP
jgi:hypothetical protein